MLLVFLDGLYPCLFPSLEMLVGVVVCRPGAVLESGVSGVFPWVVSGGECLCLALGGVCLQVVIGERRCSREADPVCFVFVL